MGHVIIDRRINSKGKSTTNRRRFVKRVRDQIKDAVKKSITDGGVKDLVDKKDKKIKIPGKGLSQPTFSHSRKGGVNDIVHPGNKDFNQGDRHDRPKDDGGGGGGNASDSGEGEDEFSFNITQEEFAEFFFEDLELPDMLKKDITTVDEFENRRAGFSVDGNPSRLNIIQSMKKSKGRRMALRSSKKKKLKILLEELSNIVLSEATQPRVNELNDEINKLKRKIKAVPFIDDMDLRYNRWEKVPIPSTQAVMFGIMDVSASMGDWEKEMAKRFFMLMLMFLHHNYERVDIVWVRHHTIAKEVDEEEFFHSKETGGTIVSGALQLMDDIIVDRYPVNQWNIFGCQISDGDNWGSDNPTAVKIMSSSLLPKTQYFAYIEVDQYKSDRPSDLWEPYSGLKEQFPNMEMELINDVADIYPIFRNLFEKRGLKK